MERIPKRSLRRYKRFRLGWRYFVALVLCISVERFVIVAWLELPLREESSQRA